jgi:RHS repeat-associated protein
VSPTSGNLTAGATTTATTPIYSYSITDGSGNSGYAANSNIIAYNDSVNGQWSFAYDGLNRLSAGFTSAGVQANPYFCWSYDSFGNRTAQIASDEPFTSTLGSCQAATNADVSGSPASYDAQNRLTGALAPTYDAAGDVVLTDSAGYLYDPEGHVCAVNTAPISGGTAMVEYIYDASGQRVAKGTITSWSCDPTTNGFAMTNQYIRGPGGEQMTELVASGLHMAWEHTNIYVSGSLIATDENDNSGTHFRFSDWLGTMRAQTNYAGLPEKTCSSLPFGDGPPCNSATEQFFTGKERDAESGLDNFGFRYYGSNMGRFMSPDDGSDQSPRDPQSWNLYSYVRNNPLTNVDDDGHSVRVCDNNGQCNTVENDQYTQAQQGNNGGLNVPTLDQVGGNTNGQGGFSSTSITDANGNSVGSATYVSDGNLDYYANAAGYQQLAASSRVVNAVAGAELTAASFVSTPAALAVALAGCNSANASCAGSVAMAGMSGGMGVLGRGLTGTRGAVTIAEQLALEEAMANPSAGKTLTNIVLKDPRFSAAAGWVKKEITSPGGVVVHWVYNTVTGAAADFKLK